MSTESKKKRGVSGASNAKIIPYRYVGGSPAHPILFGASRDALRVAPSDYRQTSTYANGVLGGVLAAINGYEFPGWQDYLRRAAAE